MKILYFDCFSGISGDMTIGALISLGVDRQAFIDELNKINSKDFHITITDVTKNGIGATYFHVHVNENENEQRHHKGRHLKEIKSLIDKSTISENAKILSKKIFERLAKAEAKIHNQTPENVHFHEVGAVDSIADIVGAAILLDMLKPDKICASVVHDGYGFAHCEHGKIPVPVPAVLEIFSDAGVKLRQINVDKELVTPTGAAIISEISESFGLCPEMNILKIGYGAGKRDNEVPNVLRIIMGEVPEKSEEITVIETNIDDCSPEILSYTMERLLKSGAKDVFFTNIYMKKSRPAFQMTVLCDKSMADTMRDIIFSETTTIGIRYRTEDRLCLPRTHKTIPTQYGPLRVKCVNFGGMEKIYVEYESARVLAEQSHIPISEIYREVSAVTP